MKRNFLCRLDNNMIKYVLSKYVDFFILLGYNVAIMNKMCNFYRLLILVSFTMQIPYLHSNFLQTIKDNKKIIAGGILTAVIGAFIGKRVYDNRKKECPICIDKYNPNLLLSFDAHKNSADMPIMCETCFSKLDRCPTCRSSMAKNGTKIICDGMEKQVQSNNDVPITLDDVIQQLHDAGLSDEEIQENLENNHLHNLPIIYFFQDGPLRILMGVQIGGNFIPHPTFLQMIFMQ